MRATPTPVVMVDIGGVLLSNGLPAVGEAWGRRLGISAAAFVDMVFGGSDDEVLIGRMSESSWWAVVQARIGISSAYIAELQHDLATMGAWDTELVAFLRRLRGRSRLAVVSNAWPGMRVRLAEVGLADAVDEVVLSCMVGCAKPDPAIFNVALDRLGAAPEEAMFVDDTAGHVQVAESLGFAGHVHVDRASTLDAIGRFVQAETD